jgi:NitT/TauT family transport system ATP-binding protein
VFDAAHMLAPVAIASSLGVGHVKVPIIAPFNLSLNGNAITVSPGLWGALLTAAHGDVARPMASAHALAHVIVARKVRELEPLTFGMTFPFSKSARPGAGRLGLCADGAVGAGAAFP